MTVQPMTRTICAAALALSSLTLLGCSNADAQDKNDKKEQAVVTIPVEVTTAGEGAITANYQTTAVLEPESEADVISRVNGIVETLRVEEGDYVKKGQVLATLRDEEYRIKRDEMAAELASVKQELSRLEQMHKEGLVSADAYDKVKYRYQATKAQYDMAAYQHDNTVIRAPISGYIAERFVKVGNLVTQYEEKALFHIVAQETLQGIVYLPEKQLANVKVGQTALLYTAVSNEHPITANIERISPMIDSDTGTFKVVLQVNNSNGQLKAGMFAKVQMQYETHNNVVLLPRYAVVSVDDKHSVFRVNSENKAEKVDITIGFENESWVEVQQGIAAGDKVVTSGQNQLKDQTQVSVIPNA
ncbi:efflux RND transporter periplasmic adaptor subunit [Idiomarina tyrosinivorans]|uniref:Efflux RND transporter periplasmic adaptor subunit n=1 Tax=Idiomarina tyrosinivorans TaxID=1445662 RepID=A0A432ZUP2_9GAMM|nr:efflux RND transporter periplasmic adaptor subunit [Idiomarina tyrosinivorans]RUO81496.1 efflux RND transporter periplasmic adaptor subunit [Idiomarina tyrosinivorans]